MSTKRLKWEPKRGKTKAKRLNMKNQTFALMVPAFELCACQEQTSEKQPQLKETQKILSMLQSMFLKIWSQFAYEWSVETAIFCLKRLCSQKPLRVNGLKYLRCLTLPVNQTNSNLKIDSFLTHNFCQLKQIVVGWPWIHTQLANLFVSGFNEIGHIFWIWCGPALHISSWPNVAEGWR